MDTPLGKIEHLDPRTLWKNEAGDFTPWLAEHLAQLGETLGLDLELEETESSVGDFSADIVASAVGTNRRVIIENQLERTDHGHLGQLLTYAGGLDAAIVVWISPEVRDEHRKALDWLNRHTGEGIDFFGVVVAAIRIDESKPAVQFRPVAVPNDWGKRVTRPETEISERNLIYKKFFQSLLDELREKYKFTNARAGQPVAWYSFASGISGLSYGIVFSSEGLRAELYIDTGDMARNKAIFDWLHAQREAIDSEMGEPLSWDRLDTRQGSRIFAVRPNTTYTDIRTHEDELRNWSIEHLLRLKKVFGPKLRDALAAPVPGPALVETA